MIGWQIFILAYVAIAVVREFFSKRLVNNADPILSVFFIYLFAVPLLFAYKILFFREKLLSFPVEFIFVGVFWSISTAAYFKAIRISLSKSSLLMPLATVMVIVLAVIFLGEYRYLDPTSASGLRTIAGLFLTLFSLWMLGRKGKDGSKENSKWTFYMIVSIIMFGLALFFAKYFLQNYNPLEGLLPQYAGGALTLAVLSISQKKKLVLPKQILRTSLMISFFATTALVVLYSALQAAPATVVVSVQSLGVTLGTVLVGLFLYNERKYLNLEKSAAMALGFVGVILLLLP